MRPSATHSESAKVMWQRPEYRAKHPRLLPPMTPQQRRRYRQLRDDGATRLDALRVVMGDRTI